MSRVILDLQLACGQQEGYRQNLIFVAGWKRCCHSFRN